MVLGGGSQVRYLGLSFIARYYLKISPMSGDILIIRLVYCAICTTLDIAYIFGYKFVGYENLLPGVTRALRVVTLVFAFGVI